MKNCVMKKSITNHYYVDCINKEKVLVCELKLFKINKHKIVTICQNKMTLSPDDNKRSLIENSTDTYAWGHWRIMKHEN